MATGDQMYVHIDQTEAAPILRAIRIAIGVSMAGSDYDADATTSAERDGLGPLLRLAERIEARWPGLR